MALEDGEFPLHFSTVVKLIIRSSNAQSVGHILRAGVDLVLTTFFAFLSYRIALDVQFGGNEWKQGDWLINSERVDVRRSATGDIVLFLSDLGGFDPVIVIASLQVMLLAIAFFLLRTLLRTLDPRLAVLLAFSPAMFTVFWVADPQGSVRKELLVFIGLLVAALGVTRQRDMLFASGSFIVAWSVYAHEALVLFFPLLMGFFVLSLKRKEGRFVRFGALIIAGLVAGLAVKFAFGHRVVSDISDICGPLLERGVHERVCSGAISWLLNDLDFARQRLAGYLTVQDTSFFALSYAAAITTYLYLISLMSHRRQLIILLVLTGLPFLPLYPIAVDWGRWASYHVFSITVLIMVMVQTNQVRLVRKPPLPIVMVLFLGALSVSPLHTIGLDNLGAIGEIIKTIGWAMRG